jgi:methionyl aminopeptidase
MSQENKKKLEAMRLGGRKLAAVREKVRAFVKPGMTGLEIDAYVEELLLKSGGEPAFKKVPRYHHATCINVNDVVVHGIPTKTVIKNSDLVCVDLGLYYQGYYTDTSLMMVAGKGTPFLRRFVKTGEEALKAGISQAKVGNHVADISRAIEKVIKANGFSVITNLTGHGVGKELHEDPYIPNFDSGKPGSELYEGQTIAIEPMYAAGSGELYMSEDGWTIATVDRSLTGLIEETVAITKNGPEILTK